MAKQPTYRTAQNFPTELMLLNTNPLVLASGCYNKNCAK